MQILPRYTSGSLRRKSCSECAAARRRCDQAVPACLSCLTKELVCIYPWPRRRVTAGQHTEYAVSHSSGRIAYTPTDNAMGLDSRQLCSTLPGKDAQQPRFSTATTDMELNNCLFPSPLKHNSAASAPQLLPAVMLSATDIIVGQAGEIPSPFNLKASVAASPSETLPGTARDSVMIPSTITTTGGDHTGLDAATAFQLRISHATRQLAAEPCDLAIYGRTTFIHHSQIETSAALQDAFAMSALHALRNPENNASVLGEIERRAALLVSAVEVPMSNRRPELLDFDMLPLIQALLVYQCIRLSSAGEPSERSQAEHDQTQLQNWVARLQHQIQPISDGDLWSCWVRQESVRRALIVYEMLADVHTSPTSGSDHLAPRTATFATMQSPLWEAKSATEWNVLWWTPPRPRVDVSNYDCDMAASSPDDVDDLEMIQWAPSSDTDAEQE